MSDLFRGRLMRTRQAIEKGLAEIPPEMADTHRRLEAWHSFYSFLLDDLQHQCRRWEARFSEQPGA